MPTRLIEEMVYTSVNWLNSLPSESGISSTLSSKALVTGHKPDYPNHCKLEFGTYVQTHEAHNNSMLPRTVGAIALRPTDNSQGGYYFYSLVSGKRINLYSWTELPMPVEEEKFLGELAMNGKGIAILGEVDKPSEISVQIAGVVHVEDNGQPQGTGNRSHGYMNADEAEYDDGQDQVLTRIEAEEIKSEGWKMLMSMGLYYLPM